MQIAADPNLLILKITYQPLILWILFVLIAATKIYIQKAGRANFTQNQYPTQVKTAISVPAPNPNIFPSLWPNLLWLHA